MRMFRVLVICLLAVIVIGCAKKPPVSTELPEGIQPITNKKIPVSEITDFYYTYENINFNAFYQRYRFYAEDGKYYFFHETREVKNGYGPATEKNTTKKGTISLSGEEFAEVMDMLRDGTVNVKKDSAASGDSGPWLYLYWQNDGGKQHEFHFKTYGELTAFEEYCEELSERTE